MEKFQKAADLADHPEKYTLEEIQSFLEDAEIREWYQSICDADSALNLPAAVSTEEVDKEWNRFIQKEEADKRKGWFAAIFTHRAAVVSAVVTISLAAMAIGGIIIANHKSNETVAKEIEAIDNPAIAENIIMANDSVTENETTLPIAEVRVFENEALSDILAEMSKHYGFKVKVNNGKSAALRLFFRWNPSDEANEAVRQLNNFERINLTLNDGLLTVN